ncbi:MAG: hypothetical protein ACREL4_03745 [Gemmatimonadales bacterium]
MHRAATLTCWGFATAAVSGVFLGIAHRPVATPAPTAVTLDGVLDANTDDTPAFTPDGATAFFDRTAGHNKTIMMTRLIHGRWSAAVTAPFSGTWLDQDPALAPDGSYLVFSSNRPVHGDSTPVVFVNDSGKSYRGANLWKVARTTDGWGTPEWLGPAVNTTTLVVAPSVAADGSVYFIQRYPGAMHIYRSELRDGKYLPAELLPLGNTALPTHDPAIAPDQSFLIFDYGRTTNGLGRLSIAFRKGQGWSAPQDLGNAANQDAPWGAHLGPDHRTVYFTGNTHIWRLSLGPWLRAH